jgi:hypothetical protein
MNRSFAVALMGAVVPTGVALASPAHADQNDFLDQLTAQGIYYRDPPGMIGDGQEVCTAQRPKMNAAI